MNLDFTSNLSASKVVPLLGGLSVLGIGAALILKRSVDKMYEKSEQEKECDPVHELPGKVPVLGHYVHISEKGDFNLNYFKEETSVHPTIQFSLPFAPVIYWTSDPAVIKRILLTGFKEGIYEKAQYSINQFKEFLGEGIFLSNGEQWKSKRKLASHLFHHRNLHKYISIFAKNSMNLVQILDRTRQANTIDYQRNGIDLQDYFMRYTLDSFCEIGFGVNINSLFSTESALKFQKAFDYVQTFSENRGRSGELWRIKEFFCKNLEFNYHLNYLNEFVNSIIEQRKEETKEELEGRTDLLSQLLLQNLKHIENDQESECFTPVELRDWIMNFLIAGRDTTAILLTWCSYLLSLKENDQYYQRVIDEIQTIYNIDENLAILPDLISFDGQKQQKELKKVLQETLRLYPPVPVDGYASIQDDVIQTTSGEKIFVKKGTFILYSAWTTHRQEYNFKDADSFNPDRFDGPIIPYSFVPFHGGPRVCLGQDMAYIEAKILMTCLLSHFKLERIGNVVPKQALILTAKNGAHFHISPRVNGEY